MKWLQAGQGCLGQWRSTPMAITGELSLVGGSDTRTESPIPDINLSQLDGRDRHLNFMSGNRYDDNFDYRLSIGDHQVTLKAFSESACKGKPIAELVSEPTSFQGTSGP